jgi:hypothetical protein
MRSRMPKKPVNPEEAIEHWRSIGLDFTVGQRRSELAVPANIEDRRPEPKPARCSLCRRSFRLEPGSFPLRR